MSNPFNLVMLSAWHEQFGNGLLRMLDGHPSLFTYPFESQIATPQSTSIIDESFVPHRYRYPKFLSDLTPEQAYQSIWDQELKTYLRTPHLSKFRDCGIKMSEEDRKFHFQAELFWLRDNEEDAANSRADYIEAFFTSTLNPEVWTNMRTSGRETHYVGYSPPILFGADDFFSDFPNGQMVHIVRNPWAGYSDTIKRPFPFSLTTYCQVWNMVQLAALTYANKYRGRFHLIRYEDLVADKQRTMDGLMHNLGLPPSDRVYYPSFNGAPLASVKPWGTIVSATAEANLATAHELTNEIKDKVRTESNVLIGMLGYNDFLSTGKIT